MNKLVFSIVLLFFTVFCFGQKEAFISGRLVDAISGQPIVFANLYMKQRALGVITNVDGSFKIPLRYNEYGDTLLISCLGYQQREILMSELGQEVFHVLKLQPAIFELTEAVLTAGKSKVLSARQIIRQAIKAIPVNYPMQPFSLVGYYRDYQMYDNDYVNLNEALLEVFDYGFNEVDSLTTKTRLYETVKNATFPRDTIAEKPYKYDFEGGGKVIDRAFIPSYGGNELAILRVHDAIRNASVDSYSFVRTFKRDLLPNHSFEKEKGITLNNVPLYVVRLVKLNSDYSAYGKLYISKINFAIHKMEYAIYDNKKESLITNKHGTNKSLIFEINAEYKAHQDKMYLNYISMSNTFQVWEEPKLILEYVNVVGLGIVLIFNKQIDVNSALNKANYHIEYLGKPIAIKKVAINIEAEDRNEVILYPDMYPHKIAEISRSIQVFANKDIPLNADVLNAKVKNIRDLDGNLIDAWSSKEFLQFREFFVQEIKRDPQIPQDALFMDNRRPIFQNQPKSPPENFNDFWMNTPLQSVEK